MSSASSETSLTPSSVSAPAAVNRRRSSTTPHVQRQTSVRRRLSFQLMPVIPAIQAPRPVEHASTIDKLARVLFPCSFLAFNLVYWLIYTTIWSHYAVKSAAVHWRNRIIGAGTIFRLWKQKLVKNKQCSYNDSKCSYANTASDYYYYYYYYYGKKNHVKRVTTMNRQWKQKVKQKHNMQSR